MARTMRKTRACTHCHKKKLKCDRKTPCNECILRGITCVPRQRAPYGSRTKRKRGHPNKARPNKKTKTNNVNAQPKRGDKTKSNNISGTYLLGR